MKALLRSILALFLVAGCGNQSPTSPTPQVRYPPVSLLRALKEPRLETLTEEKTNHVYRFICRRSFHQPFCIVLKVSADGTGTLICKMLSSSGAEAFGAIKEERQSTLPTAKVQSFLNLVQQAQFWNLESGDTRMGFDGSDWIIEAVYTNRYKLVSRWSPETITPVNRIGGRLIEMADLKIEKLY